MNYLSKENVQAALDLSLLQDRLYQAEAATEGADRTVRETESYEQGVYELAGAIDPARFQAAWDHVISLHPLLRTVYRQVRNRTVQVLLKSRPIPVEVHDLRGAEVSDERIAEQPEATRAAHSEPFALGEGPLMRLTLLVTEERKALFVWTAHAILLDGVSRQHVLADLLATYDALAKGATLPEASASAYKDYLTWIAEQDRSPARGFWQEQLAGFETATPLLNLRPSSIGQKGRWETHSLLLTNLFAKRVEERAAAYGVSSATLVQAAWAVLLQLYAREEQVTFGYAFAGRSVAGSGFAETVGRFGNVLPLSVHVEGERTVAEFLSSVQEQIAEIESYAYIPLADVRNYAQLSQRQELFHSVLTVEDAVEQGVDRTLQVVREETATDCGQALQLRLLRGEDWHLNFRYDAERLSEETVGLIGRHWQTMLTSFVEQPNAKLSELNLLSEEDRERYDAYNVTKLPQPHLDKLAHQLFEEQAARHPEKTAAVCGEVRVTYQELNEKANRLAHWLREQGFGRDDLAALFAERNVDMLVAILAVMKAGGAYVPLDSAHPNARLQTIVNSSGAKVILTQHQLAARAVALAQEAKEMPSVFSLDAGEGKKSSGGRASATGVLLADASTLATYSTENPAVCNEPNDLANVFFTSGSTGQPKGAMVEHVGMLNHLWAKIDLLKIDETSVVVQNASHCFDISVWQFLAPVMRGGTVVVYPNDVAMDPQELLQRVQRDRVTILELVPAVIEMVLQARSEAGVEQSDLPDLQFMISTGEGIRSALAERWLDAYPQTTVINTYGATECSDDTHHEVVVQGDTLDREYVTLGTPIPNFRLYLVDRYLRPVPVGVIGEVGLTGIGVGRGYLKDAEKTAAAFVPNPFADGLSDRMYRTGDLARLLPDGRLEFISRADFQVKVRGHRIELGEVEAGLLQHPEVAQAVAIVRADAEGQNRILAYVIAEESVTVEPDTLREHLHQVVPEYMVPEHLILLDTFPLNRNGKVDRNALPEPEDAWPEAVNLTPPRDELEAALADVWADVLGVQEVGIDHSFFQLGGHSLKMIQIRSRIKQRLGLDVPLMVLFRNLTIRDLAPHVRELQAGSGEATATIPRLMEREFYPMSHAQQRLFFIHQLDPQDTTYNQPVPFELLGVLDVEAVKRAVQTLVDRHYTLRTTFHLVNGQGVQKVLADYVLDVPLYDLTDLPAEEREEIARGLVEAEGDYAFDLSAEPSFKVQLVKMDDARHLMLVTLHHIISDAWSGDVMVREFVTLYQAYCHGQANPLPDLPIQYVDYAAWQNDRLNAGALDESEAYWLRQFSGELPVLQLPTDRPRPAVPTHEGGTETLELGAELSAQLESLAQGHDATLYMILLAALGVFLQRMGGGEDLIIGSPEAGRNRMELEGLIGFFINTLGLRLDLSGNPTFLELLERVKGTAMDSFAHQELPFDRIVEKVNPVRDLSRSPLLSVLFQVNMATEEAQIDGLVLREFQGAQEKAKFDLNVAFQETAGGLRGAFTYSKDLFDDTTIARWLGHFRTLLAGIVAKPEARIAELPMLTDGEREALVVAYNRTDATHYPLDKCLHELISEQAARTPEAVALVFEGERMTYGELNSRANQLAHHLQKRGVGPDSLVGLCVERSFEMLVGMLGIMKAGGAYVPLDPAYPADRLAFVMEDSGVQLVLTQEHLLSVLPSAGIAGSETGAGADTGSSADHDAASTDSTGVAGTASGITVLALDRDWPLLASEPTTNPHSGTTSRNLIYMIYTSGSTGRPKGVLVEHRGVVNRLLWGQETYKLTAQDRVLQKTPFSFDVSVEELFWPLLVGAQLVIARPGGHQDTRYLASLIAGQGITTAHFVPSMLQVFLEESSLTAETSLRRIFCSGEGLPVELQKRFFTRLPQTELHNTYGPTETCVEATYYPYRPQEELTTALVPIGYPIRNVQAYILDAHGQPVPHGVSGELHLGGACVTRGYHNRPDLTAEKYVPNPFLQANEQADGVDARLYKTGDIVRLLPDGAMEFLGRVDHQVKIRGFRIELGEIESLLLSLEGVREVTVVAREDVSGDKRIVAYLVAESGAAPMQVVSVQRDVASHDRLQEPENASSNTSQQLRSYLQSRLPEYMVPSTFVWLDAMPLTSSGKTDRKALPAPERQVDSSTYVAPRDGLELEMARLWEEVLDLAAVGIHDNFFLIGGHSLKALALSNRIKEQFGVTLPLALLFQAPTVADLCRHVRAHRDGEEQILIPLQQGTSSQPPLFLIHPQGGGVLSYFHLVRELGTEQTVYGLQAVGFESDREPLTSLEAMADLYLAEMRKVASRGPYRLAGWSFGGVLAYELARRLEAEDEGVEFFGLLDAMPPSADTTELLGSSGSERQALEEYALAYGVSQEELSDLNEDDLLDAIIRKGEALLLLPTGTSPATVRQKLRVMMACGEAQATYQPTNRLRTDIHLFYVQERAEGFANDLIDPQDWVAYTDGDLLAHPVPGHHHNMVEPPHVQTLAARIKQALTTRARV